MCYEYDKVQKKYTYADNRAKISRGVFGSDKTKVSFYTYYLMNARGSHVLINEYYNTALINETCGDKQIISKCNCRD